MAATTLAFAASPSLAVSPNCTHAEDTKYANAVLSKPVKCHLQLNTFNVCDDDCLRAQEMVTAAAADCMGTSETLSELAAKTMTKCVQAREDATNKYMPINGMGLVECTSNQEDDWEGNYTSGSAYSSCTRSFTDGCSDDCVKLISDSVTNAPPCLESPRGYWIGERQKSKLVRCLVARGDTLAENKALNSVKNGDGTFTLSTTPVTTSAPPSAAIKSSTQPTTSATGESTTPPATSVSTKAPSSAAVRRAFPVLPVAAIMVAAYSAR